MTDTYVSLQSQYHCIDAIAYLSQMSASDRIQAAMKARSITSAAELARLSGLKEPTVRSYLNGTRTLSTFAPAQKLARALGVTAEHLLDGDKVKPLGANEVAQVQVVAVRGKIQAGVWHEFEDFDGAGLQPVPTIPGRWYAYEQFAFQVAGDSVNKLRIFDGDFVICAHYWQARGAMADGDIVAVERRRGPSVERTVKRLKVISETSFELWPESTNPRHQEPIRVEQNGPAHEQDGTTVEIVGLVIGRWAPF